MIIDLLEAKKISTKGGERMEAMLFLLGFTAVAGIYEVTKTGKKSKSKELGSVAEKVIKKGK